MVNYRYCPICGAKLVKFGNSIKCSKFPECRYSEGHDPEFYKMRKCPDCGGDVIIEDCGSIITITCSNPNCNLFRIYNLNKERCHSLDKW